MLNIQADTNKSSQDARQKVVAAVKYLDRATYNGSNPTNFLTLIDEQQSIFYHALATAYPAGYAKLLALKISNLFVARYHFIERHTKLASSPIQLMIDPSNVCQLQCPGCVHTGNPEISKLFDWPNGFLSNDSFEEFIRLYGPFAFGVVFYNYGEPFLNKNTPQLIRRAKDFLLHTCLSSNLSIPKIDADAVVHSGLNCLFASFDGATQETYGTYRRRGRIELGYGNVQSLVEAKKRLGLPLPYIEWKFLTFEHNVHEIDLAIAKGRELGVNEVHIATPFAVDWDDPSIQVVDSPKQGRNKFTPQQNTKGPLDEWHAFETIDGAVEEAFAESWVTRGEKRGALKQESNRSSSTCRWLYQSITLDALDRIAPCCMPPQEGTNRIYGKFRDDEPEPFNAKDMIASRLAFADRSQFEQVLEVNLKERIPFCAKCDANPELTYTLNNVHADLMHYDRLGIFNPKVFDLLTEWPLEGRFESSDRPKENGSNNLLRFLQNNATKALKYTRDKLSAFLTRV
jgi:pyruvate-formate lyase-activating enzyme